MACFPWAASSMVHSCELVSGVVVKQIDKHGSAAARGCLTFTLVVDLLFRRSVLGVRPSPPTAHRVDGWDAGVDSLSAALLSRLLSTDLFGVNPSRPAGVEYFPPAVRPGPSGSGQVATESLTVSSTGKPSDP